MNKSYSLAQFIMNCGDYELALNLISFYMFVLESVFTLVNKFPRQRVAISSTIVR